MGTGQELRVIHHALVGVKWLRGSHEHLLASVWSTLAEFEGDSLPMRTLFHSQGDFCATATKPFPQGSCFLS
jgi:hypothetical protein